LTEVGGEETKTKSSSEGKMGERKGAGASERAITSRLNDTIQLREFMKIVASVKEKG